jgi:hypothetical protein
MPDRRLVTELIALLLRISEVPSSNPDHEGSQIIIFTTHLTILLFSLKYQRR